MKENWCIVKSTGRQRFYRLGFLIKNFPWIEYLKFEMLKELIDKEVEKRGYEVIEEYKDGFSIVCVSDAHTHTERLVFPVIVVKDKSTGEIDLKPIMYQIDGKHTFMIDGGDERDVYRDETYLHRLRIANK